MVSLAAIMRDQLLTGIVSMPIWSVPESLGFLPSNMFLLFLSGREL